MTLEEYLALTLPGSGNYFVESHVKNKSSRQIGPLKSLTQVAQAIRRLDGQGRDTYIATGSFSSKRDHDHAQEKACHYTDIDCGEGKKYEDKREALDAVVMAIRAKVIPMPSIILDSGNGIHLYWILASPVPVAEWQPTADRLKQTCLKQGLKIDPTITADAARILRPPETHNYKNPDEAKPCRVLKETEERYDNEELFKFFPEMPAVKLATVDGAAVPGFADAAATNSDLTEGVGGWFDALPLDEKIAACRGMLKCIDDMDEYGRWMRIGAALHATGRMWSPKDLDPWYDLWDEWSQQAANYDSDALEEKWGVEHQKFSRCNIGTLIFLAKEGGFQIGNFTNKVDTYPDGYFTSSGGTWRKAPKEGDVPTFIMTSVITDAVVTRDADGTVTLHGKAKRPSSKLRAQSLEVEFADTSIRGESFKRACGRAIIGLDNNVHTEKVANFMKSFTEHLLAVQGAPARSARRFGWHDRSFVVGTKEFTEKGVATGGLTIDRNMAEAYSPCGSFEKWQKAVQFILDQRRPAIDAVIASAFASPLLRYTGATGVMISIAGRDSGTGKSTALRAAQSVWGNPQIGVNALGDTTNSIVKRLEILHHLPSYWDELRMKHQVQEFVKVVFQLAQGKGKSRLTQKAELQTTGSWETLIAVASNEPLSEHIETQVGNTDSGLMRLLEMEAPPLPVKLTSDAMLMFKSLDSNYGEAGVRYAQWLVENQDVAKQKVGKIFDGLTKALGPKPQERFWISTLAALIAGAYLANQAGLLRFDVPALTRFLKEVFLQHRHVGLESGPREMAIKAVIDYINDSAGTALHTNKVLLPFNMGQPRRVGGAEVRVYSHKVDQPRRGPIAYQRGRDDKVILIPTNTFREWLYTHRSTSQYLFRSLKLLGVRTVQATVGKGTFLAGARQRCLLISAFDPTWKDVFE